MRLAVHKAEHNNAFFPVRERFQRFTQIYFFDPTCVTVAFVAHLIHNVKRVAVVAVNRVEKRNGVNYRFKSQNNFFSRQSEFFRYLFRCRFASEFVCQLFFCRQRFVRRVPHRTADPYRVVVPQIPPQFAYYHRHGVCRKPYVLRNIEIVYRFYQPYAADLKQVVGIFSSARKASENAQNKFQISSDKPLPRRLVSRLYFQHEFFHFRGGYNFEFRGVYSAYNDFVQHIPRPAFPKKVSAKGRKVFFQKMYLKKRGRL